MITNNAWDIKVAVANHPKTHPDTLHVLSTDGDMYVIIAAKEALEKRGLL